MGSEEAEEPGHREQRAVSSKIQPDLGSFVRVLDVLVPVLPPPCGAAGRAGRSQQSAAW